MTKYTVLESSRTALLVIDVQRALFTRPNPVYEESKMIGIINGLVERAHLYGVPVVFIQHSNEKILQKGSNGWKLHPALNPEPDDYKVQKTKGNSFLEPALMSIMEARDIRNVIITGLVTQNCVRATSLGGLNLGYQVLLVKGGHSNYSQDPTVVIERVETELEGAGVHLVDPGEIAFR